MQEYLTNQQYVRLLERATAPRDSLLLQILYETGCTITEVVEIQGSDIDADTISIGARQCRVSRQLSSKALAFYETHNSEYLFASRQSPQISPKRAEQLVKKQLRTVSELKKPVPQVLRYSHIIWAYKQGVQLVEIARQTGLLTQRISQILGFVQPREVPFVLPTAKDTRTQLLIEVLARTAKPLSEVVKIQISELTGDLAKQAKQISSSKYMFASRQGGHISEKRAEQLLSAVYEDKPTNIRYAAITRRRLEGESIEQLAESLGIDKQRVGQIIAWQTQGNNTYEVMIS